MSALGRRVPQDFRHVAKYPMTAVLPESVETVEIDLTLPAWHESWDQGKEGACVGFGCSMMMSILNEEQARKAAEDPVTHRYDARWLWHRARLTDEFPDNDDLSDEDQGTTVRAGCEILRVEGHVRVGEDGQPGDDGGDPEAGGENGAESDAAAAGAAAGADAGVVPSLDEGISAYRWATTVDQMRSALADGNPVAIGVTWCNGFDSPEERDGEYWLPAGSSIEELGGVRGGHCVCLYGASDEREAFHLKNSWGTNFPLVWLPYQTMEVLLSDQGEAALITDR